MAVYYAIVHQEEDSAFGIAFPDLPGCYAAADEEYEVFGAAQAALSLFAMGEVGLPSARSLAEIRCHPEVAAELRAGAFLIAVPLIDVGRKARFNVMLSAGLVEGADKVADGLGISRSEFVAQAIGARFESEVGAVLIRRNDEGRIISESTSKKVSSAAAKVMKSKTASKAEKSVAASALTQTKSAKETTGKAVATSASKILKDPKASKQAKSVAASALTQKTKAKKSA